MIHTLADLAIREKDHATFGTLPRFVKEQVEEEENAKRDSRQDNVCRGCSPPSFLP